MIQVVKEVPSGPRIYVVGVGGAGCNAVDSMYESQLAGVTFLAVNTDRQALELCKTDNKLQIGMNTTCGLGTGGDPDVGKAAALEDAQAISDALRGADLVFLTAGLGGGTGSGATPVIADIAKREIKALTVAIVTKPFVIEGTARMRRSECAQLALRHVVDTLITVPNEKLMKIIDEHTTLTEALQVSNRVLMQCVQSISDLITQPGLINLDFAAIRAIMNDTGGAVMGVGFGQGPDRANIAFQAASSSPLMEEVVIEGARGILINITGGPDLTLREIYSAISDHITSKADPDADIHLGVVRDDRMQDEMKVTILATGFAPRLDRERERDRIRERPQRPGKTESQPAPDLQDLQIPAYLRSTRTYDDDEPISLPVPTAEPAATGRGLRLDARHLEPETAGSEEDEPLERVPSRQPRKTREESSSIFPRIFSS